MAASTSGTGGIDRLLYAKRVIAPVGMALVDLVLTFHGQTGGYWAGDYAAVREGNPLARQLMEMHPVALLAAYLPYVALIALLVVRSRSGVGDAWALVFTVTHAFGASTWVLRQPGGMVNCVVVWLVARWLYGWGRGPSWANQFLAAPKDGNRRPKPAALAEGECSRDVESPVDG